MRNLTESEIKKLKLLTEQSVEITLIEPTANGLNKSIMDATVPVRLFLKANGIHDYEQQRQGENDRVYIEAKLIDSNNVINSKASLYRPITKQGDPRIWFTKLKDIAIANNIIGIIAFKGTLCVINVTTLNIETLLKSVRNNPLKELVAEINSTSNEIAKELLVKLREISRRSPIPAQLAADTAVGRTLETLLGIAINSSRKPDYKGIELKAYRNKRENRKNLFAQVANWDLSKFKSSSEVLKNFGYKRKGDFRLYCTVSTLVRNSQGLKLRMDNKKNQLVENSDKKNIGDFLAWALETLHNRLLEKHNETFWISTKSEKIDSVEYFTYTEVKHTKKPIVSQFDILLEQGLITLDHLIKKSKNKVVEKGPLFKIKPKGIDLLFPPSQIYSLLSV